jgi:hypothetical protein
MRKYVGIFVCLFISIVFTFSIAFFNETHITQENNSYRIDFRGSKTEQNIQVISSDTDFEAPTWCKDCLSFTGEFGEKQNDNGVKIKIKVKEAETVTVNLMGPYKKINDVIEPVWVMYNQLKVDNEDVLKKDTLVWHDKPYKHKINLNKGQSIELFVVPSKPSYRQLLRCAKFDFVIFLKTFVFLLMLYCFMSYCNKNKSNKIDGVFIGIFMLLLIIPMLYITPMKKSEQENRVLATMPSLFVDNKLNQKYGMQFDVWFNDRFFGRDIVINNFSKFKYALSDIYQNDKALLIKHNGWMFNKRVFGYPKDANDIINNFKNFQEFCHQHNIKLYVLLVPDKEDIYSKILGADYKVKSQDIKDWHRFIAEIQKASSNNNVIFPYDELVKASEQDYVFFKQAHHWTDFGAYTGYKSLAQRIKKDFPKFKIVSLDEYNQSVNNKIRDDWGRDYGTGHTTRLLNLVGRAEQLLTTNYIYYDDKKTERLKEVVSKYTKDFQNNTSTAKYKLFLTGNSQNEDLLQFLAPSVKQMKYLRINKGQQSSKDESKFMKYYKQELLDFKPDIMVICVSATYFTTLMTDFYKD